MVAQRAAQETWNRLTQSSIRRLDLKVSQRPSKLRPWRQDLEIGNDICKISRIGKILRLRTPKRRLKFLTHFMREGECISLIRCFPWAFDEAAEMPDQLTEQEWFGLGHKVLRLQEHVAGRSVTSNRVILRAR